MGVKKKEEYQREEEEEDTMNSEGHIHTSALSLVSTHTPSGPSPPPHYLPLIHPSIGSAVRVILTPPPPHTTHVVPRTLE
jgi:hypothetical protein